MGKIQSIPLPNSNPLVEKFTNYIMQDGKKSTARQIIKMSFEELQKKGHKNPEKAFQQAVDNVSPTMEVRPKRIGGAVYQIPMEVKSKRKLALALRWMRTGARARKGMPMYKKLALEIEDALNNTGFAIKKKEDTLRMAQANKAFAHFARY